MPRSFSSAMASSSAGGSCASRTAPGRARTGRPRSLGSAVRRGGRVGTPGATTATRRARRRRRRSRRHARTLTRPTRTWRARSRFATPPRPRSCSATEELRKVKVLEVPRLVDVRMARQLARRGRVVDDRVRVLLHDVGRGRGRRTLDRCSRPPAQRDGRPAPASCSMKRTRTLRRATAASGSVTNEVAPPRTVPAHRVADRVPTNSYRSSPSSALNPDARPCT